MSANKDRLYELLPAIHRIRDTEKGGPLKELLRVITEQVNLVEEDIAQLYDNWFIETCEDWVVPYIADLVGYRQVHEAGEPGDVRSEQGQARNKILIPRREVANTIGYRRRKGTLALLELLAKDVADWPTRAVEFYPILARTQAINHLHPNRGRSVDVRKGGALDLIDGPFDEMAHTVDVRRINSFNTQGRYNIPSIGLFAWRLKAYSVTKTPAFCIDTKPHCFTFSVLGNDAPLFLKPRKESDPTHIADELILPVPIRRRSLEDSRDRLYGEEKSFFIWKGRREKGSQTVTLSPLKQKIVAADLTDWAYFPRKGTVAVDPVLGRIAFSKDIEPKDGVWVSYHYGFSADIGGGEYDRTSSQPAEFNFYRVEQDKVDQEGAFDTLGKALQKWRDDCPPHAVIEIDDSRVYAEPLFIEFVEGQKSLQLRAANGKRPVIRLQNWLINQPDAMVVTGPSGSRFTLDGLMVTGRGMQLNGDLQKVTIRHSILVPGWDLDDACKPKHPTEPSLEIFSPNVCLVIEHSIVGAIQVSPSVPSQNDESLGEDNATQAEISQARCQGIGQDVRLDPIRLCIGDSILDAITRESEAIGAPGCVVAHAVLTMRRCTVFGQIHVRMIEHGENCIFNDRVFVARRQYGCLRFCYVPPGSRTPPRYHCQPDLVEAPVRAVLASGLSQEQIEQALSPERMRVRPQFNSRRYGSPTYCQLANRCAEEIKRGADDASEMGVFHDLYQPQRTANLRARLEEHTPAGADVEIIFSS